MYNYHVTIALTIGILILFTLLSAVVNSLNKQPGAASPKNAQLKLADVLQVSYKYYSNELEKRLRGDPELKLDLSPRPNAAQMSIEKAFDDSGRGGLLILGEPGAGKSILLLQLAQRLAERALQDKEQRLPVVLKLSTWTNGSALESWLFKEVSRINKKTFGGISPYFFLHWIEEEGCLGE